VANDEAKPSCIGIGRRRGRRRTGIEGVDQIELSLGVGIQTNVQRVDRNVGERHGERRLLVEDGADGIEGRHAHANITSDERRPSRRIEDRQVGPGQTEESQAPQGIDADLALEGRGQDGVDLAHGEPPAPGGIRVDGDADDHAEDEENDDPQEQAEPAQPTHPPASGRRARRTSDRLVRFRGEPVAATLMRGGSHQYACPIPTARASGRPRMVG
jgi:hypothetical protein